MPLKELDPVFTIFLSAFRKSELKKLTDLLPQLFWGSEILALIVFLEDLWVLSTSDMFPIISSFFICKGLDCIPLLILSVSGSAWVSTFNSYLPLV